jgi:hypothetical protein
MPLDSIQDVLALVATICAIIITGFLCWALYEIARLVRQANEVVSDTREKIGRVERLVTSIAEKVGSTSQYLGFIAEGGKQLLSFLHRREENAVRKQGQRTKKKMKEVEEEVLETEDE